MDYFFPCLTAAKQIRDIIKANTRKQSIYFDVADFASVQKPSEYFDVEDSFLVQSRKQSQEEKQENHSDTEENMASKPFRLRSGTDISDMLSSAKHRRSIRKSLQIPSDAKKTSVTEVILEENNLKAPISRRPSLDLGAFVDLSTLNMNSFDKLLAMNEEESSDEDDDACDEEDEEEPIWTEWTNNTEC